MVYFHLLFAVLLGRQYQMTKVMAGLGLPEMKFGVFPSFIVRELFSLVRSLTRHPAWRLRWLGSARETAAARPRTKTTVEQTQHKINTQQLSTPLRTRTGFILSIQLVSFPPERHGRADRNAAETSLGLGSRTLYIESSLAYKLCKLEDFYRLARGVASYATNTNHFTQAHLPPYAVPRIERLVLRLMEVCGAFLLGRSEAAGLFLRLRLPWGTRQPCTGSSQHRPSVRFQLCEPDHGPDPRR